MEERNEKKVTLSAKFAALRNGAGTHMLKIAVGIVLSAERYEEGTIDEANGAEDVSDVSSEKAVLSQLEDECSTWIGEQPKKGFFEREQKRTSGKTQSAFHHEM